jgi:hypothetical protein
VADASSVAVEVGSFATTAGSSTAKVEGVSSAGGTAASPSSSSLGTTGSGTGVAADEAPRAVPPLPRPPLPLAFGGILNGVVWIARLRESESKILFETALIDIGESSVVRVPHVTQSRQPRGCGKPVTGLQSRADRTHERLKCPAKSTLVTSPTHFDE